MELTKILVLSLALAFLTESMVEYLFGSVVNHVPKLDPFRWLLMYVAAGVGIGLAFFYKLDLLALIVSSPPQWVGMLASGFIVGRGANYLHDFVSTYLLKQESTG